MSEEKIWNLVLELVALAAFGAAYYFWQRKRILNGPPDWQEDKLVQLFQMGLECANPQLYADLPDFLNSAEKKVASDHASLDLAFIERWKDARLPEDMLALLTSCHEWWLQYQPKTR